MFVLLRKCVQMQTEPPFECTCAHTYTWFCAWCQMVQMRARLVYGFLSEDGIEQMGGLAVVFLSSHHKQKNNRTAGL